MAQYIAKENVWFEKEDKTIWAGETIELTAARVKEINNFLGKVVFELVKSDKKSDE
ncbi:TPA: hypothetical protein ACGO3D_000734 [Streptococcus suis]